MYICIYLYIYTYAYMYIPCTVAAEVGVREDEHKVVVRLLRRHLPAAARKGASLRERARERD